MLLTLPQLVDARRNSCQQTPDVCLFWSRSLVSVADAHPNHMTLLGLSGTFQAKGGFMLNQNRKETSRAPESASASVFCLGTVKSLNCTNAHTLGWGHFPCCPAKSWPERRCLPLHVKRYHPFCVFRYMHPNNSRLTVGSWWRFKFVAKNRRGQKPGKFARGFVPHSPTLIHHGHGTLCPKVFPLFCRSLRVVLMSIRGVNFKKNHNSATLPLVT